MDLSLLLAELGPAGRLDGRSRQQRLYESIKRSILDGSLSAGMALPSSRSMALTFGMARNSVIFAFEHLRCEGFLEADTRSTRVAKLPLSPDTARPRSRAQGEPAPFSRRARQLVAPAAAPAHLPFASGVSDLNLFPWQRWSRHLLQAWKDVGARHLAYAPPGGEHSLREAVAAHLRARRGLASTAEQVLITPGAQVAIDICARMLADPGDAVWVEDPGYPGARTVFQAAGLQVIGVKVDAQGLSPPESLWERSPPRLVFTTPSHQYPMGSVMSLPRRLALLEQCTARRTWIIEDDYDSELHHAGQPLTALQGLSPQGAVIYVGTFSKSLYPGLRLGYMVAPTWAAQALAEGLHQLFRPGQAVEQLALARFIGSGDHERHLRKMRSVYQARQSCLRRTLSANFAEAVEIHGGSAGTHLTIVSKRTVDDRLWASRAAALGITARPLSDFAHRPRSKGSLRGLVLGYGVADERSIATLIPRLRQAMPCEAAQFRDGPAVTLQVVGRGV